MQRAVHYTRRCQTGGGVYSVVELKAIRQGTGNVLPELRADFRPFRAIPDPCSTPTPPAILQRITQLSNERFDDTERPVRGMRELVEQSQF